MLMSFENTGKAAIAHSHLPKTREAIQHDVSGEREHLSQGDTAKDSAAPRRVISNPISGEHIVIHTSGA
jgi:hypothetical protein